VRQAHAVVDMKAHELNLRHAVRVSPQMSNRMIDTCRSVVNRYIPDIYLYSDVYKGEESGKLVGGGTGEICSLNVGAGLLDMRLASSRNRLRVPCIAQRPSHSLDRRRKILLWLRPGRCCLRLRGVDVLIGITSPWCSS
jgi:hypothetical protein